VFSTNVLNLRLSLKYWLVHELVEFVFKSQFTKLALQNIIEAINIIISNVWKYFKFWKVFKDIKSIKVEVTLLVKFVSSVSDNSIEFKFKNKMKDNTKIISFALTHVNQIFNTSILNDVQNILLNIGLKVVKYVYVTRIEKIQAHKYNQFRGLSCSFELPKPIPNLVIKMLYNKINQL
jgi:hypothetical protein